MAEHHLTSAASRLLWIHTLINHPKHCHVQVTSILATVQNNCILQYLLLSPFLELIDHHLTLLPSILHPLFDILKIFYLLKLNLLLLKIHLFISILLEFHLISEKLLRAPQILVDFMHCLWREVATKWLSCGVYVGFECTILHKLHFFLLFEHTFQHFKSFIRADSLVIELLKNVLFPMGEPLNFSPDSFLVVLYIIFRY